MKKVYQNSKIATEQENDILSKISKKMGSW